MATYPHMCLSLEVNIFVSIIDSQLTAHEITQLLDYYIYLPTNLDYIYLPTNLPL